MTQLIHFDDVTSPPSDDPHRDELAAVRGGVISIGNFDGVHHGHGRLLGDLKRLADERNAPAVAVTFDPHPAAILRPDQIPPPLTDMATRAERMSSLGIDALVVCRTTPELLNLTADSFYNALVADRLDAAGMVEGPNFFFGRDRGGSVHDLGQWCERDGRAFEIVQATEDESGMISSSRIRELILRGEMVNAAEIMGWPHRVSGTVIRGEARGRTIGFPTANLDGIPVVIPPQGVYGGKTTIDGTTYVVAIHIGPNPTFNDSSQNKVEVHILDYAGDLYDTQLAVDVQSRVRDIARFDSADALVEQLKSDIQTIRGN